MDEIFKQDPTEWYHQQILSSAHDSTTISPFDMPRGYVLFVYPRDATPVCTAELKELHAAQKNFPIDVIAGSTDSPEVHNWFYNDPDVFEHDIKFPVLTISPIDLTDKGKDLLLNAYGYCKRVAIIVSDERVRAVYEMDNNTQRDITILLSLTRSIANKKIN